MSYYKPSFSQTIAMTRGRGNYTSPRAGNSYRGSSSRGSSSWTPSSRGGYSPRGGGSSSGGRFSSSYTSPSFDRNKYSSDRFSGSSRPHSDDYRKSTPYKQDSSYGRGRIGGGSSHRSPDRKRIRTEAPSSRHSDSSYGGYGSSRFESRYSDRPSFASRDRHIGAGAISRRDEFRRPTGPPPSSRGGFNTRGRMSSRGSRGIKLRDRPARRRLIESSYAVRKRVITPRSTDYARKLKISRMRSDIAARRAKRRSTATKDEPDTEKKEEKEKHSEVKKENEVEETEAVVKKEKETTEKEPEKSEEDKSKKFIKLNCPHCNLKSVTFRKYEMHLSSKTHLMAMRKIAMKQKSILSQMRQAQRNTQNELEKSSDDLTSRTSFCPLCKLNYKQRKSTHQDSESHKNMKKFLMPVCKVCNTTFKSPMMYESHCCSIEHMKRKQRVENGNCDGSGEDDNLENFTTIDSVGDIDDLDDEEKTEETDKEPPVNVGIEQIRKVEAHYCDLCKMYLSRGEEGQMAKIISRHCKMRVHMQRYVRYKEDKDLEKRAEKLQRKELAEKEVKVKKEKSEDSSSVDTASVTPTKDPKETKNTTEEQEASDDKLWADVDKDLGDILAEAESVKMSDDEEDEEVDSHLNGERYDRFKMSERNDEEDDPEENAEEEGEGEKSFETVTVTEEVKIE